MFTMLLGAVFNFIAIVENGGKMPVFVDRDLNGKNYATDTHFYYDSKNEVNYYHLTDIIPLGDYIASVGDFFLVLSLLSSIILTTLWIIQVKKDKKEYEKTKKKR